MNYIKKLAIQPAAEKTREGKGGKPEKFWTMAQIEAVKKMRATSSKKNSPVADVIVESVPTATNTEDNNEKQSPLTLEQRAEKIRRLQADVQRGIIEIGFELIAAKKEIGHGNWSAWLEKEFSWTQRTANNFMRVAERFGKMENVFQFQPSTLQAMLALPEGTEEDFAREQAETGKPLETQSAREVQRNVREWKQKQAKEIDGEYLNVTGATKNNPVVEELNNRNDNDSEIDSEPVNQNSDKPAKIALTPKLETFRIITPEQIIAVRELIDQTADLQTIKAIRDSLSELAREIGEVVLITETKIWELSKK